MVQRAALFLGWCLLLLGVASLAAADHTPQHTLECAADPAKCKIQDAAPPADAPAVPVGAPSDLPKVKTPGILDQINSALGKAGDAVGDAAGAVGGAISDAFGAIGRLVAAVAKAVGDGVEDAAAWLTHGVVGLMASAARTIGLSVALVGALLRILLRPLAELFVSYEPRGMSPGAYAAASAGVTAVAAGGLQAGLYALLRRYGLWLALVPGFSRIAKDELLEHDRRARIYELIKQNPGVRLSELAHGLELPWGSAMHHLRKLRADRLIMFKAVGHHKCYFVNGSGLSEQAMAAASILKGDTLTDIATFLQKNPRASLKELAVGVGISSPLAAFHVGKLEKAGLVTKERDGRSVRLLLAPNVPSQLPGANAAIGTPVPPTPTAS